MKANRKRDLLDSAYDFQRLVWPVIVGVCGGGTFEAVEGHASERLQEDLDVLAGIDGMQRLPAHLGLRGIASRIQWGDRDWGTFTIRETRGSGAKTELEKRLYAIQHPEQGILYPHLTVQAYITKRRTGRLLSVAVAQTKELISYAHWTYAAKKRGVWRKPVQQDDGSVNWFLAVDWRQYEASGNFIEVIRESDTKVMGMPLSEFLDWVEEMRPIWDYSEEREELA